MIARGALIACTVITVLVCAAQNRSGARRWTQYEDEMQTPVEDPPDAGEQREFAFARLRYRAYRQNGYYERWAIDCNRADRFLMRGIRRITRIDARSIEQIIDVEDDTMFLYPWLYAVSAGDWNLSPAQAGRLRSFLERGGFLMVDDFHGEREWASFMAGIAKISPGHRVIDLEDDHPIFHTIYDLAERVRVPGYNVVRGGQVERGGVDPRWRAVLDDQGRVQVAICFNMDLGDAWEFADAPDYPEEYATMAFKMGANYMVYALTH